MGRKYRSSSDEYRRDYLNIVKKLTQEKATAFEKKLAFHFIKHTEGEDEKKVAIVSKEFKVF